MGTFLTNDKMSPALRARIEASVTGRRIPVSRRAKTSLRRLAVACAVGTVLALVWQWRVQRASFARERTVTRDRLKLVTAPLKNVEPRMKRIRQHLAANHAEQRHESLDTHGGWQRLLSRPMVYLRGSQADVSTRLEMAAAESSPDAFVGCLLRPPPSREEADLAPLVSRIYREGVPKARDNLFRLQALLEVRPLLAPAMADAIELAKTHSALATITDALDAPTVPRAEAALKASLFLYVVDEPKPPGTVSELDGASEHHVRVGLVDLDTGKVWLRTRRLVDPAWVSEQRRVTMAKGLVDCRLAVDLRGE